MTAVDHGLRLERDRFRAFAFTWADLVIEANDGRVVFAGGATGPLLGTEKAADLAGVALTDLVVAQDRRQIAEVEQLLLRHGRVGEVTVRLRGHGQMRPRALITGHCLQGDKGTTVFLAFRTKLRIPGGDNEVARDEASGLYAADGFHALAAARLQALRRTGQQADLTLVSVGGLDRLGDRLGSEAMGDVMATLGTLLRARSVDGETAAQVDAGKFGILSSGTDLALLEKEIGELISAVDESGVVEVSAANVGIGDAGGIAEEDLAKGLLYTLQKFGSAEGRFNLHSLAENMTSLVDKTVQQIQSFKGLVTGGLFEVALQPVISLRSGDVHHFEALCRFKSLGRDVSPYKVINFAEETGLIHEFDLSMATKVMVWLSRQPRNNDMYRVAVNVSGFSISQPSYVDGIFELLRANPWAEGRLMFEITESSRMSDLDSANAFIQRLRAAGYEVCLDDFGAGAASFQYLSTLEVDVVKLDGSAVKSAQKVAKGRAFLSALTELCRRLSVDTVAEMVDTPEALQFVKDCGCDFVQGWLFGKPSVEVKDFMPYPNSDLLRRRRS